MIFGNPLAPRNYQCRSEVLSILLQENLATVFTPFIDDFTQVGWRDFVVEEHHAIKAFFNGLRIKISQKAKGDQCGHIGEALGVQYDFDKMQAWYSLEKKMKLTTQAELLRSMLQTGRVPSEILQSRKEHNAETNFDMVLHETYQKVTGNLCHWNQLYKKGQFAMQALLAASA